MKTLYITFILLLPFFIQAQSLNNLEKALPKKQGLDFVKTAIQISKGHLNNQSYDKAMDFAEQAYSKASKMGEKNWMAVALNCEAKAMFENPKPKLLRRGQIVAKFQESFQLSSDRNLRLENLEYLRQLAIQRVRKKDLEEVERLIANEKEMQKKNTEQTQRLAEELAEDFTEQLSELESEKDSLEMETETLSTEKEIFKKNQTTLQNLIFKKEAVLKDMSEAQMRQELMLTEQRRLLDSLVFTRLFDSLALVQNEMILQQNETELKEQQAQLELQNSQRNFLIALAVIILILAFASYSRYQGIKGHNMILEEKNLLIREEKKRSEELLLNILPATVAKELMDRGAAKTRQYEHVTVLFTDFKNFSKISKQLSPEQLIGDLDYCFKNFDRIIGEYGLEKIKTIGDAYMCAGGIPQLREGHPYHVVRAALDIQSFLMDWKLQKIGQKKPFFEARVGIHTGPIIAGVVGAKKFAYDIWGDTVNVASRMETGSEPGKVNISASTYELIKDQFECEYRGKVPAKNYGEVDMYFVKQVVG